MAALPFPDQAQGAAMSIIKKIDPRSALICAFLLSCQIACLAHIAASLCALGGAAMLFLCQGRPGKPAIRSLCQANAFILFLWLIVPWTTPGQEIWRWRFIVITDMGLELALLASIKANAIMLIFLTLVAPISPSMLGSALYKMKVPRQLVWMLLLMGRNIHLLAREWRRLGQAARLRGFRARANWHSYKTIAAMLAILLLRTHERAEILRQAMLLRGFSGKLPCLALPGPGWRDAAFCCLAALFAAVLAFVEIRPGLF